MYNGYKVYLCRKIVSFKQFLLDSTLSLINTVPVSFVCMYVDWSKRSTYFVFFYWFLFKVCSSNVTFNNILSSFPPLRYHVERVVITLAGLNTFILSMYVGVIHIVMVILQSIIYVQFYFQTLNKYLKYFLDSVST